MAKKLLKSVFVAVCLVFLLGQRAPVPPDPQRTEKPLETGVTKEDVKRKRLREGTTFQGKRVFFRALGNRTVMHSLEGNESYVCLENLNLERILKAIDDKPARGVWKVDGTFTEFRGENFVLIQRAVVSPTDYAPAPTAPK